MFKPKLPYFALTFVGANLILTCLAEKAFIRDWLQECWMQRGGSSTVLETEAIVLSARLFEGVYL